MSGNIDLGSGGIQSPVGINTPSNFGETSGVKQKGYSQQDIIEESKDINLAFIALLAEFPVLNPGILDPDAFAAVFFKNSGILIDFNDSSKDGGLKESKLSSLHEFTAMLDAARVLLDNMKKSNETVNDILDKWNESINQLNEEYNRMIESPSYQAWKEMASPTYEADLRSQFPFAYNILIASLPLDLQNLSPNQRGHEVDIIAQREMGVRNYLDGLVDKYSQYKSEEDPRAILLPFLVTSAVIDLGLSQNIVNKVSETTMGQALDPVKTAIPPQLVDTAVITINLFATNIALTATFNTILDSASKGAKPVTKEMAENFAREVIAKIGSNEINGSLLLLLQNKIFGSEVTHERISQLIAIAKVMMALQALIILYKSDTKWITAEELSAMLKGKIPFQETSLAYQLVTLINYYRNQLSPALQVAILSSMMYYAESKNRSKDDDAFNTLKVVQEALDTELFDTFGIKG